MKKIIRILLWKILGIDYKEIRRINDIVTISKDKYTKIGVGTYHNGAYISRSSDSILKIGNYCSIAKGVWFIIDDNDHLASPITTSPLLNIYGKKEVIVSVHKKYRYKWEGITVGNDVWIGMNAIILPNVTIGNGVIIAAGSVITNDVPDYAIVAGTPAKLLRYRFEEDIIEKLLKLKWWDWDEEFIKVNYLDFYLSVEEFLYKYDQNV